MEKLKQGKKFEKKNKIYKNMLGSIYYTNSSSVSTTVHVCDVHAFK